MRAFDHRSPIVQTAVRAVFHAVLLTSLFFLVRGHNAPGGGFIAGLVAGTAFLLRYLAGEDARPGRPVPGAPRPGLVLGAGLLVAAVTAAAPLLGGGQLLESGYAHPVVPVLGEVPLASALAFDTGVYLVVVGMVLAVLSTLGAQEGTSLAPLAEDDDPGEAV
ncbi:MnhB domain-containing protein [Vallicoccus soli]|uniref:MnhB domain-containing protein n=1 Tax=Vallicoccus soli TaxID=2339232 RepID=UPI001C49C534|nr:MnhB domain-containing protein [Vallicoccus soli]